METFEIGEQRRLSFRIKVDWPVTLETKRGLVQGEIGDISPGGAHIRCTEHLELNESVFMTIKAPDREPMKVAAVVIWSNSKNESNQPRVIGVKFNEISQTDRRYLEKVALEEFKAKLPQS